MRRLRLFVPALLALSLCAASTADAASSKRCSRLVPRGAKVVAKGRDSMVISRGSAGDLTLTYYACVYVKPRLYKLPGQNGGDTEFFGKFTLGGKYLAYAHINQEQAATFSPGYVVLVDVKRRKKIFEFDAVPVDPTEDATTNVSQILLRTDGAVAWIGDKLDSPDVFSVQTALPGQAKPAEVDRGSDVGKSSLQRVAGNDDTFSWLRGGQRKEAAFGGPTVAAP
jgi:hypothetical protein